MRLPTLPPRWRPDPQGSARLYGAEVRKLGFRNWRGIGVAVRLTLSTPAGWWFLAARVIAIALAFWVNGRYGDTAAIVTLLIAIVVAGLVAPPPPDVLDSDAEECGSSRRRARTGRVAHWLASRLREARAAVAVHRP
ncbi:hypothetical protein GCM10009740_22860 [Terrabacter terrae]|uniref:DUF2628 domain-containing protein n=1 Tax=Terrabacter terrae TaxID=318434 RepID=A0ABP5FTF7_9MICO